MTVSENIYYFDLPIEVISSWGNTQYIYNNTLQLLSKNSKKNTRVALEWSLCLINHTLYIAKWGSNLRHAGTSIQVPLKEVQYACGYWKQGIDPPWFPLMSIRVVLLARICGDLLRILLYSFHSISIWP